MINVQVDATRVLVRISRKNAAVKRGLDKGITRAALKVLTYIKEDLLSGTVLRNRTGTLRRAVFMRREADDAVLGIGKEAPYGKFHEFGVDHSWMIEPRKKKALAFSFDGESVFARRVEHPGLEERSFMRRGVKDKRVEIVSTIDQSIDEESRRG